MAAYGFDPVSMLDILGKFGLNVVEAGLAIPALAWPVGESPRTHSSTRTLVRGAQIGLNKLGWGLATDGMLGDKTATALARLMGEGWRRSTWSQTYLTLLKAVRSEMAYGGATQLESQRQAERRTMAQAKPEGGGGLLLLALGAAFFL